MAKKVPSLFRKPIKAKNFDKKILRLIEQNSDKEYLRSCFELQDGYYKINKIIDKKEIKKLIRLAKDIKANRAWSVKVLPLAAISAAAAAVVVFVTVFMNPLLEKLVEKGLETAFEARSDVDRFNLNLLRFRISIEGVTVADRDSPMTNLFQMGHTEIRLLPQAVLQGKIYIEEISAASLRFGTPRTVSGELPNKKIKAEVKQAAPKKEMPPLVDLSKFDPMELINAEYDKLQSVKLYDEAFAFYNSSVEKWTGQVDATKQQIADLQKSAQPFINFNMNSINPRDPASVQKVLNLINDGKIMIDTVKGSVNQVNGIVDGLQADVDAALALQKQAQNSIQSDITHLTSYLDFSTGTYTNLLDPIIQQILTGAAKQYIYYGKRALELLETVKSYKEKYAPKESDKPKKAVFKGRDVAFPSRKYPFFYLGKLASDFTIEGWKSDFDLREVSSDPDLVGKPTTLKMQVDEVAGEQKSVAFNGRADFRQTAPELFDATVNGKNFGFGLEQQLDLKEIGVGGFKGSAAFGVSVGGGRDGSVKLAGQTSVMQPQLIAPNGTIAIAVDSAIREAGIINIGFNFAHTPQNGDSLSINTNIGELIVAALKKAAAEYAKKAIAELEKAMRAYITSYIGDKYVSSKELDTLFAAAKGDKTAVLSLQGILQNRINEMEQKVKGAAEEKLNEAVNEAQKQAEDSAKKALGNIFGGKLPF